MIGGIIAVIIGIVIVWIIFTYKATKDPDVQAASDLRMSITRYNKYKQWYDTHIELMQKYGVESKEADEYFRSFFKQIKNPNEWKCYQDYRSKLLKNEMEKMFSYRDDD